MESEGMESKRGRSVGDFVLDGGGGGGKDCEVVVGWHWGWGGWVVKLRRILETRWIR